MKKILFIVICILFLTGAVVFYNKSFTVNSYEAIFKVASGDSFEEITNKMLKQHIIRNRFIFQIYAFLFNIERNVKAGSYLVKPKSFFGNIVLDLKLGNVTFYKISVISGKTICELLRNWHDTIHTNLAQQYFSNNLLSNNCNEACEIIIHTLNLKHSSPEGMFYPDTFYLEYENNLLQALKLSHKKFKKNIAELWLKRDKSINKIIHSPYEALILASIIEKETSYEQEKKVIAGVFMNRLLSNMRLQADPTVIYGLGDKFNGNLTKNDLKQDTPYNTYIHKGLPPTPIATVSNSSIYAVLHPQKHKYIYFMATKDGKHTFSENLTDHRKAIIKYYE